MSSGRSCGRRYQVRAISVTEMRPWAPTTMPFSSRTSLTLDCKSLAPIRITRSASFSHAAATAPPDMMAHREPHVRNLGKRRFQALPVTMSADPQFESPVGSEAGQALLVAGYEWNAPCSVDARSVARLFRVHRDPDADETPVGLATRLPFAQPGEANRFGRAPQSLRIVSRVEMPLGDVVERHLLRAHEAAHAQRRRLDSDFSRQRIERHL